MDENRIIEYITKTYAGIEVVTAAGSTFFMYDPEQKFPFATLVTNDDAYDSFSKLGRPSVFRLNIGVSKETYRSLFGTPPATPSEAGEAHDFTVLDQLLPHPVYGRQYWVCILNPSQETFQTTIKPLLDEAYNLTVAKYSKRARQSHSA